MPFNSQPFSLPYELFGQHTYTLLPSAFFSLPPRISFIFPPLLPWVFPPQTQKFITLSRSVFVSGRLARSFCRHAKGERGSEGGESEERGAGVGMRSTRRWTQLAAQNYSQKLLTLSLWGQGNLFFYASHTFLEAVLVVVTNSLQDWFYCPPEKKEKRNLCWRDCEVPGGSGILVI